MSDRPNRNTTLWNTLASLLSIHAPRDWSDGERLSTTDLLVYKTVALYGGTPEQIREARKPRDCGDLKLSTREIAAGIVSEKASLLALGIAGLIEAIDGHHALARAGLVEALTCKRPIGSAFRAELQSLGIYPLPEDEVYPEPEDIAGGDDNAG